MRENIAMQYFAYMLKIDEQLQKRQTNNF